jgi:hypothetical protein
MKNSFRNRYVLRILFGMGLLSPSIVCAEKFLPFWLPFETEQANQIVHGQLDSNGKLAIQKVLKGKFDDKKPTQILSGKELYQSLQAICPQPGTIEMVLYLSEEKKEGWQLTDPNRGVVFFHNEDVYMLREGERGNHQPSKHPNLKRTKFLEDAQKMAMSQALRDNLLSQKPSPERIGNLVSFLHVQPEEHFFYYLNSIRRKVPSLGKEEEQALLELFQKSDFPVRIDLLLKSLILILKSPKAFDAACSYLDHQHSREIRQAAIEAMIVLDLRQAQIKFLEYMHFAEPELNMILNSLHSSFEFEFDPRFLEPITQFTQSLRELHHSAGKEVLVVESYTVISLIAQYGHPKMMLMLTEWALAQDHVTSDQAIKSLQYFLGMYWSEKTQESAKTWFEKAKPFLEADYDLKTQKGLNQWFDAYKKTDSGTRRILLRLWAFESKIDEKALLEAASQKETQEAAQEVLKTLWSHQRLSGESRKAIIEKFVRVELIEITSPNVSSASRELQIVAHRTFHFPAEAWVENRSSITIGNEKPNLDNSYGSFSLDGMGQKVVGSMGGGSYPGTPKAQAILHLREIKRGEERPRVLWEKEWTLGPIPLKEIKK